MSLPSSENIRWHSLSGCSLSFGTGTYSTRDRLRRGCCVLDSLKPPRMRRKSRLSLVRTSSLLAALLIHPRQTVPESKMPGYRWLTTEITRRQRHLAIHACTAPVGRSELPLSLGDIRRFISADKFRYCYTVDLKFSHRAFAV